MKNWRDLFLLDPDITFLNHGSFGACPVPVFESYQNWQRELERQPVEFLGRRADTLMNHARERLAAYLNVQAQDLVFVMNATSGVNIVARSLKLQPGDEILSNDHEYGACTYTWQFVAHKTGATLVTHNIALPVTSPEDFVESLWAKVTPRTKVLYISHITSPTALIFPVQELCRRARAAGIMSIVDGAHAPGQIPLDLTAIDADVYTGNLHKWLCAPKGAAFLHVQHQHHAIIEPATVSWGYLPDSDFVTRNQWQGTRDISPFLAVPAAIDFQAEHDWESVRKDCRILVSGFRAQMAELFDMEPVMPDAPEWFNQMAVARIPTCDALDIKRRLYDDYKIEIPLTAYKDEQLIRISVQAYNTADDVNRLLGALKDIFNR